MAGYIGNKAVGINVTTGDILGDVGVGGDVTIEDDLFLDSDSATIHFGEDNEVKLIHVADNGLQLTGSGLNSNFTLAAYHTTDGTVPDLDLKKSGSSTIGTNAATANAEALGQIRFSGVDTSGNARTAVKMSVAQVGTASNAVNGNFTLDVEGDIILDASGNVSVANGAKFFLSSSSGFSPRLQEVSNALTFFTNNTERFRIATNGDLTATDTSIGSNSDARLKENIADYTYDVAKFKQYEPKTFDWINSEAHNGRAGNRGFLAQAVKNIDDKWVGELPVSEDSPDYNIISDNVSLTSKLGEKDAMYISVIQQLIARIEVLEG